MHHAKLEKFAPRPKSDPVVLHLDDVPYIRKSQTNGCIFAEKAILAKQLNLL
jgi:hypothetical protein